MSEAATKKRLRLTLVKSTTGRLGNHQASIRGLGLRRIGHTVEVEDTPSVRGMVRQVHYLLDTQEV